MKNEYVYVSFVLRKHRGVSETLHGPLDGCLGGFCAFKGGGGDYGTGVLVLQNDPLPNLDPTLIILFNKR